LLWGVSAADVLTDGSDHTLVAVAKVFAVLCVIAKVLTIASDAYLLVDDYRCFQRSRIAVDEEQAFLETGKNLEVLEGDVAGGSDSKRIDVVDLD